MEEIFHERFCMVDSSILIKVLLENRIYIPVNVLESKLEALKLIKENLYLNDALIAATCKHYGITKIATFDDDFAKVGFLEVVKF